MSRRRMVVLAGAAAAAAVAVIVGVASAGQAERESQDPTSPVVHDPAAETGQKAETTEKYWTEERQRQAQPKDMPEGP